MSATITEIVRRYVAICDECMRESELDANHLSRLIKIHESHPVDPATVEDPARALPVAWMDTEPDRASLCAIIDKLERMRVADPPPRTTLETVRMALGRLLEEQGAEPVREVLGLFDCRQASELRARDYAAVIRKAEEHLKG